MNEIKKERLYYLLDLFTTNSIEPRELKEMLEYLEHTAGETIMEEYIQENGPAFELGHGKMPDWEVLWQNIQAEKEPHKVPVVPIYKKRWMQVAASLVFILLLAGIFNWTNKTGKEEALSSIEEHSSPTEILPGSHKAQLVLDDGVILSLDDTQKGLLAEQGNTKINQNSAGEIVYNATGVSTNSASYNTLITPKGGQFNLVLPDGSRVWLNAASSIRFPTAFAGNTRDVTITGEVYFEVVRNTTMPFIVTHNDLKVTVLGTSFCINTYANEPLLKTTLVNGLVEVSKSGNFMKLEPGQQVQFNAASKATLIQQADIEEVLAWKNGIFNFDKADLETVMRQIERWYDITIEYPNGIPKQKFWGKIQRNLTLNDVLDILRETGVKFTVRDRTIIITPK